MSNAIIGALRVNLGLDAAQFQRGARQAEGALSGLGARMRQLAAVAAAASAGLALAVRGQLNAAEQVGRQAQVANTSVEAFQRWAAASRSVGIEGDKLADILKDMNDRIGDFISTGGGPMRDFFEQIAPRVGVTAEQFRNLSGADALQLYVSSLEQANLNQAEMTFYMEAIASDATALLPLLRGNGAELNRLADAAERAGLVMSQDTIAASRQFMQNLRDLTDAGRGLVQVFTAAILPALVGLSGALLAGIEQVRVFGEMIGGFQGYIAAAAIAVSASFVPALYAATVATGAWISSLITLRGVLLATGIGAFVVGAGMAINWLIRLRESTGSWAEALGMLADVARGVWTAITESARAIPPALNAIWARVNAGFNVMVRSIMDSWSGLMTYMRPGFDAVSFFVPGFRAVAQFADAAGTAIRANIDANIEAGNAASERWGEIARANVDRGMGPLRAAMERIRLALSEAGDETVETTAAITALNNALRDTEAAGGGARAATDSVRDGMEQVNDAAREVEQSFESAFVGFLTGAKSAREAIADLLRDLARMAAQAAFRQLFGGLFSGGGFLASLFGGFRANGGPVMPSRAYVVGERGPEMFVPSSAGHIVPNDKMGGQGGGTMAITVNVQGANGDRHIETLVQQGVTAGIREYDRLLPDRIGQFTTNQRRR